MVKMRLRRDGAKKSGRSNKFDTIIEYFIVNKKYNIIENNAVLFEFDLPLI